ncbi:MAG TPA: hypothetical protein VG323_16830 [Thermoanaerobaculia bacterium]|nr:hypothetical protein [Thermoanaerobaculia bacterium]
MVQLLVAHPGHELLLYAWMARNKPVVHVLTDGPAPRLERTAELLRDAGARPGAIFGRLSDREAYAMILERNSALLVSLAEELAAELERERPAMIVVDAAEGYNPVHDLCRLVAGAAMAMAGVDAALYEYAVVGCPSSDATMAIDLDDAEFAAKIARARAYAATLTDVDELLSRHGPDAYRREAFRRVGDWTAIDGGAPPLYERFGQERVAAGRYARVIRRDEHMLPLRDALRAEVEKRSCAF